MLDGASFTMDVFFWWVAGGLATGGVTVEVEEGCWMSKRRWRAADAMMRYPLMGAARMGYYG
jgi:hypothetical protein